jgi:hypothetical protein
MAKNEEATMEEAVLTEEMLQEMRGKIGLKLRTEHSQNNAEATFYPLTKFADGIGDPNPLWHDEEYANKTRYGRLIAHPSWVWTVLGGIQFGFRGLGTFHSGSDIYFHRPVYLGDKIRPECIFTSFDELRLIVNSLKERLFSSIMRIDILTRGTSLLPKFPSGFLPLRGEELKQRGSTQERRRRLLYHTLGRRKNLRE